MHLFHSVSNRHGRLSAAGNHINIVLFQTFFQIDYRNAKTPHLCRCHIDRKDPHFFQYRSMFHMDGGRCRVKYDLTTVRIIFDIFDGLICHLYTQFFCIEHAARVQVSACENCALQILGASDLHQQVCPDVSCSDNSYFYSVCIHACLYSIPFLTKRIHLIRFSLPMTSRAPCRCPTNRSVCPSRAWYPCTANSRQTHRPSALPRLPIFPEVLFQIPFCHLEYI